MASDAINCFIEAFAGGLSVYRDGIGRARLILINPAHPSHVGSDVHAYITVDDKVVKVTVAGETGRED